jgi:hypothetical protein
VKVDYTAVATYSEKGQTPSDHFPVVARVRFLATAATTRKD